MMEYLLELKNWLFTLGEDHGVNPLFLACLYLTSKVFFFTFLGLVLKNLRAKKPVTFLLLFACASFSVPYIYIIIFGYNISIWIYLFIAVVYSYGAYSIWKKVTTKPVVAEAPVK
ncbi:hypothetical protein [Mucilaginibacter terrae]|uniref:Neutral ceramidase superfamily lipid hydrolase n=1 Tax=Mucilaginibacter terrae TaxID=1955052 RepID=A0ABU3GXZ9_9SPHI|nr:hypothetical protein [Mucilaginibacter terrae]MDT3404643.1 putative neutral ceramidase superfamily lipid hydrolase [Mucilaginibacter terrae]